MAEVAGLVIGGISLAAAFDQCITVIKYFDAAASCNDDFQDAALMLTLLGGRLDRWERSLRQAKELQFTEEDGEDAERALERIRKRLEEAEKLGSRYTDSNITTTVASQRSKEVSRILTPLRKALKQDGTFTLAKRARWALFDQEKMTALVDQLDKFVGSLEKLFPLLHDQRVQMAKDEAAALMKSDDTTDAKQALEALRIAAVKVDKDFDVAAAASSHTHRNIDITGNAAVNTGDYYSQGWAKAGGQMAKGGNHSYDGIRISGDSKVNVGNMYGGKSVFET